MLLKEQFNSTDVQVNQPDIITDHSIFLTRIDQTASKNSYLVSKTRDKVDLALIVSVHVLQPYKDQPHWSLSHQDKDSNMKVLIAHSYACFNYFILSKYPKTLDSKLSKEQISYGFRYLLISMQRSIHKLLFVIHPLPKFLRDFVAIVADTDLINNGKFPSPELHTSLRNSYIKEYKNICRNSNKQLRSISSLVNSIYTKHSKVLVLRLDLCYRELIDIPNQSKNNSRNLDGVHTDNQEFLKHLRSTFKNNLLGYVWKLEFGHNSGYHLHYLIFLNGQKHQKDITINQMLADEWINNITSRQGRAWNCNAFKNNYKNIAIGMTSYQDDKDALKSVMKYFTKIDLIFNCYKDFFDGNSNSMKKHRTFGCSQTIKKKNTTRSGRPRIIRI